MDYSDYDDGIVSKEAEEAYTLLENLSHVVSNMDRKDSSAAVMRFQHRVAQLLHEECVEDYIIRAVRNMPLD